MGADVGWHRAAPKAIFCAPRYDPLADEQEDNRGGDTKQDEHEEGDDDRALIVRLLKRHPRDADAHGGMQNGRGGRDAS